MTDIERARERKAIKGKRWRGVTNELVVSHADPDCKVCSGGGEIVEPDGEDAPCECAELLFEVAYKGRIRWNEKRHRVEVLV